MRSFGLGKIRSHNSIRKERKDSGNFFKISDEVPLSVKREMAEASGRESEQRRSRRGRWGEQLGFSVQRRGALRVEGDDRDSLASRYPFFFFFFFLFCFLAQKHGTTMQSGSKTNEQQTDGSGMGKGAAARWERERVGEKPDVKG